LSKDFDELITPFSKFNEEEKEKLLLIPSKINDTKLPETSHKFCEHKGMLNQTRKVFNQTLAKHTKVGELKKQKQTEIFRRSMLIYGRADMTDFLVEVRAKR